MKIGSLFAGIGGFDLAAQWVGWETAWFSEIEPYASAVLKKHWPNVPNHGDITKIKGGEVEKVDILCGGFPCQDISLAGKGAGIEGTRSGLWRHYARLIEEIRPRYVVAENVSALRSRGLDTVLRNLMALGYDAEWHCIPAAYVGAPHRRDRIWIVAWGPHANKPGLEGWASAGVQECAREWAVRQMGSSLADTTCELSHGCGPLREEGRTQSSNCCADVADAEGERPREARELRPVQPAERPASSSQESDARGEQSESRSDCWNVEPNVGRVANRVPSRVDRLRCLGNAIVPQVAYLIFRAIQARENAIAR